MSRDTATVLDCHIDRLTLDEAVDQCERAVVTREPMQHMAVNAAKLVAMRDDAELRAVDRGLASWSPPTARPSYGRRRSSATRCPSASPAST